MIDPNKGEVRDYIKYAEEIRESNGVAPAAGRVRKTKNGGFPKWTLYVSALAIAWFVASSYTEILDRDVRRDIEWLMQRGGGDRTPRAFTGSSYKGFIRTASVENKVQSFRLETETNGFVWLTFLDVEIPDDNWARKIVREQMVGKEMLVTNVVWHDPAARISGNIEFRDADIGSYFVSKGVAIAKETSPVRIHELESLAKREKLGVWGR